MNAPYYAKLTAFLLLAAIGGLLGAALGAAASFFVAPVIYALGERVLYSPNLLFFIIIFLGCGIVIASFIWAFVRSYTILVRTFW